MSTKVFITGDSGEETFMGTLKQTNPKDAIGSGKLPLHLWPETATLMGCLGLMDGAEKYGRANYRAIGVRASIYVDACKRHLNAWFEGEDRDPDSGLPHLAHALACLAILVDAQAADQLTDDRQIQGGYRKLVEELTPHVARLKKLHADKSPKHYTIADNKTPEGKQELGEAEVSTDELIKLLKRYTPPKVDPVGPGAPVWQRQRYPYPLGGEVNSTLEVRRNDDGMIDSVGASFDDDEIAEMCRLAKSGSVTLPLP